MAQLGRLSVSICSDKPGQRFAVAVGDQRTQVLGHEDHDDPAATVAASPVDQPRDTTLRKGVFRLWQGLADAMQGLSNRHQGKRSRKR